MYRQLHFLFNKGNLENKNNFLNFLLIKPNKLYSQPIMLMSLKKYILSTW